MPLSSAVSIKASRLPCHRSTLLLAALTLSPLSHAQQDFATFADFASAARAALNSEELTRLEFTASGWEGCLGQPWRIDEGWARWELSDYHRVLDFAGGLSVHDAQRRAGLDPDRIGGCGAQPAAAAGPQQSSITPQSPLANQLTLWLTPQGFVELAAAKGGTVMAANGEWTVEFNVEENGVTYPFVGHFNAELLPERIETHIDNTVYGDMLVEAEFSDYRDFGGVMFPAHLVHKQGGFAVLDLTIDSVTPNTTASAEAPARPAGGGGGGGGAQAAAPPTGVVEVGPGIFVSHGAYQSVFVEFDGYSVVIDGLQNDARAAELIAQVKEAIPGKPIRYVIPTHNHFDHTAGLRAFAAEGATIITHNANVEFFKDALATSRTLAPPEVQGVPQVPVDVMGVGDFFALSDETQQLHLHRIVGDSHADDMLIAYLPSIKTIVEADILQPWISPQFGGNYDGGHPFLKLLADELDRLDLDYTQFIPIHRPPQPPFQQKAELMTAIGRTE